MTLISICAESWISHDDLYNIGILVVGNYGWVKIL